MLDQRRLSQHLLKSSDALRSPRLRHFHWRRLHNHHHQRSQESHHRSCRPASSYYTTPHYSPAGCLHPHLSLLPHIWHHTANYTLPAVQGVRRLFLSSYALTSELRDTHTSSLHEHLGRAGLEKKRNGWGTKDMSTQDMISSGPLHKARSSRKKPTGHGKNPKRRRKTK